MPEAKALPGRISVALALPHETPGLYELLLHEAASEIERLTTRLDAVEKALGEAVTVASLLYQNSELCARNHHWTTGGFTMPGWLADASETIERARSALPQGEGK